MQYKLQYAKSLPAMSIVPADLSLLSKAIMTSFECRECLLAVILAVLFFLL